MGLISGRNVRWPDFASVFLQIINEEDANSMISIDMADIKTCMGDCTNAMYYRIKGSKQECIDIIRECSNEKDKSGIIAIKGNVGSLYDVNELTNAMFEDCGEYDLVLFALGSCSEEDAEDSSIYEIFLLVKGSNIRQDDPLVLARGSSLKSAKRSYHSLEAFESGGTSICYHAKDDEGEPVLIKEVFPMGLGNMMERTGSGRLVPRVNIKTVETDEYPYFRIEREEMDVELLEYVRLRMEKAVKKATEEKELERDLMRKGFEFFEPYYDWFEQNGTIYTVYRDYGKGTLADYAYSCSVETAVMLTRRILEALKYLHKAGYLHLDISPENILLGPIVDGVPTLKFIDLGSLVLKQDIMDMMEFPCKDGFSPFELTSAAVSMQARKLIGESTDTYSVGAVLYYLLTRETVSWEISRRGNEEKVTDNSCAVSNSRSMLIDFADVGQITGKSIKGVSPRVISSLNAFLGIALSNNPNKRFKTAEDMDKMTAGLYDYIEKCRIFLGKSQMPDDFMANALKDEEKHLGKYKDSLIGKRLFKKQYSAGDIRKGLLEDGIIRLKKSSLADAKKAVQDYVSEYYDDYYEIAYIDESDCPNELFEGRLEGSYSDMKRLEFDKRTLLVFFEHKEDQLRGGIAEMESTDGNSPSFSIGFIPQNDSMPHQIIITAPELTNAVTRWKILRKMSIIPLPFILLLILIFAYNFTSGRLEYYLEQILYMINPSIEPWGGGYMYLAIRDALSQCRLLGSCSGSPYVLEEGWAFVQLLLLRVFCYAGIIPGVAVIGLIFLGLKRLWKTARESYLLYSVYMAFTSQVILYVAYNLSLGLVTPILLKLPFIGYVPGYMLCYGIGLAIATAWICLDDRRFDERTRGWEPFRAATAIVISVIVPLTLRSVLYFLMPGGVFTDVVFAVLSVLSVYLIDFYISFLVELKEQLNERMVMHNKGFWRSLNESLTELVEDDEEEDYYDELDE